MGIGKQRHGALSLPNGMKGGLEDLHVWTTRERILNSNMNGNVCAWWLQVCRCPLMGGEAPGGLWHFLISDKFQNQRLFPNKSGSKCCFFAISTKCNKLSISILLLTSNSDEVGRGTADAIKMMDWKEGPHLWKNLWVQILYRKQRCKIYSKRRQCLY